MIYHHPATPEVSTGKTDFKEIAFDFMSLQNCSISEVHVENRFPDGGYAVNRVCNLAVRVMKGYRVTLFIKDEKETLTFSKGTGFEIPKGIPFYVVTEPSAIFYVVSEPPFDKEQLEIVTFDEK